MKGHHLLTLLLLAQSAALVSSADTEPRSVNDLHAHIGDAALDRLCSQTFSYAAITQRDLAPRALKTITSTIRRTTTVVRPSTKVVTSRPVKTVTRTQLSVSTLTRTTTYSTRTYTQVVLKRSTLSPLDDLFFEVLNADREGLRSLCDRIGEPSETQLLIQARAPTTTTVKRITTTSTRYSTKVTTRTTLIPTTTTVRRTTTATWTETSRVVASASATVSASAQKYVTCPDEADVGEGFVLDDSDVGASAADQMECRYTRPNPNLLSIFCQYSTATGALLLKDRRTNREFCPAARLTESPKDGFGCLGLSACPTVNPDPKLKLVLSQSRRATISQYDGVGISGYNDVLLCYYLDAPNLYSAECAYDANTGARIPDEREPDASCPTTLAVNDSDPPTTYCLRRRGKDD